LIKWQAEDFATATKWIAAYKTIRPTVQRGKLYRLVSPDASVSTSATMYVGRDQRQAVLFQMLHSSMWRDNPGAILPLGLAPEQRYRVRMLGGGALPAGIPTIASGRYWMTQGIRAPLKGDFVGAAFVFEAAP
jgi:alpha-galactosidase